MAKYMMATKAIHSTGKDLSSKEPVKDELHVVKNLGTLMGTFRADSLIGKYRREIMGYRNIRF